MICARRTSPAPSFCERVIRASLCPSSSLNARTRRVIATSQARTGAPSNAPDPAKSYLTYRMHHLAEFERSLIRERTQAGLAAARRLGRTGGRPPKLTEEDIEAAKAMLANPEIAVTQIAQRLGVSPATLYRYLPAARTANIPALDLEADR